VRPTLYIPLRLRECGVSDVQITSLWFLWRAGAAYTPLPHNAQIIGPNHGKVAIAKNLICGDREYISFECRRGGDHAESGVPLRKTLHRLVMHVYAIMRMGPVTGKVLHYAARSCQSANWQFAICQWHEAR